MFSQLSYMSHFSKLLITLSAFYLTIVSSFAVDTTAMARDVAQQRFQDPLIQLMQDLGKRYNMSCIPYYTVMGGNSNIETSLTIPIPAKDLLCYIEKQFENNKLPYKEYYLESQNIYIFKGIIDGEEKSLTIQENLKQHTTLIRAVAQTNRMSTKNQFYHLKDRFPELLQIPGNIAFCKEIHFGKAMNVFLKTRFKGSPNYAIEEIDAWLKRYGWSSKKSTVPNVLRQYEKKHVVMQAMVNSQRDYTMVTLQLQDMPY